MNRDSIPVFPFLVLTICLFSYFLLNILLGQAIAGDTCEKLEGSERETFFQELKNKPEDFVLLFRHLPKETDSSARNVKIGDIPSDSIFLKINQKIKITSVVTSFLLRSYQTGKIIAPKKTVVIPLYELDLNKEVGPFTQQILKYHSESKKNPEKGTVVAVSHSEPIKGFLNNITDHRAPTLNPGNAVVLQVKDKKFICKGLFIKEDWETLLNN